MYTIGSFLREEELTGLKLMSDTADLQAEITNINIIDTLRSRLFLRLVFLLCLDNDIVHA